MATAPPPRSSTLPIVAATTVNDVGISRRFWNKRYELAKACAKDDDVNIAISELQKSVSEELKLYRSFLQAPEGVHCVCKRYPSLKIVTSEIDARLNDEYRVIPGIGEFGDRYFGTDD